MEKKSSSHVFSRTSGVSEVTQEIGTTGIIPLEAFCALHCKGLTEEPIVNYNQCYQNLVERVKGCQLNSIRSAIPMEWYLGSIIEPIRKSICNTLYFNSKHAPKMLGEAIQKAQDLHINNLYAIGEDQDSVTSRGDVLSEITINEVTSREDIGWYKNKCNFREHSQNLRDMSPQGRNTQKE